MSKTFFFRLALVCVCLIGLIFILLMSERWHSLTSADADTIAAVVVGVGGMSAAAWLSMLIYERAAPYVSERFHAQSKVQAYEELLRLKKLLDERVISQSEFDAKAAELKARL